MAAAHLFANISQIFLTWQSVLQEMISLCWFYIYFIFIGTFLAGNPKYQIVRAVSSREQSSRLSVAWRDYLPCIPPWQPGFKFQGFTAWPPCHCLAIIVCVIYTHCWAYLSMLVPGYNTVELSMAILVFDKHDFAHTAEPSFALVHFSIK